MFRRVAAVIPSLGADIGGVAATAAAQRRAIAAPSAGDKPLRFLVRKAEITDVRFA